MKKIKTALISVSDKKNLKPLLISLKKNNIKIISSGGTFKEIRKLKFKCLEVSEFTNSPEILEGRVKTLHPKIHAGILNKRKSKIHQEDLKNNDFENIDLSIVIGANDIVNPSALEDPNSPIAGMPVIECWRGTYTVVLKRGMSTGYAGVENPLFFKGNTRMLFGDAKESLLKAL